ncbi:hypothetical protein [Pseudomonas phage D6]|nr:hypothetical protein [Pseudomonas phage D6]
MMFFKSLHWYEWLLAGVIVAMLGVGYLVWDKYEKRTEQVGGLITENSVLTETVKYQDQSATISDQVVTEFVQQKEDVKEELQQSREGVIDDYIDMATAPVVPAPSVDKPKAKVATRPKAVENRPAPERPVASSDADRIVLLANRMHDHYCKAAPERGTGCNAIGTNR